MSDAVVSTSVTGSAATTIHRTPCRWSAIRRTVSAKLRALAKMRGASKR